METKSGVTVLNFGPGPFWSIGQALGQLEPEPDQLVEIPHSGSIPELVLGSEVELVREMQREQLSPPGSKESYPSVRLSLLDSEQIGNWNDVYLVWISGRQEWVALHYTRWRENAAGADECWGGPYSLDDFCEKRLAVAFGVKPWSQLLRRLRRMPPDAIFALVEEQRSGRLSEKERPTESPEAQAQSGLLAGRDISALPAPQTTLATQRPVEEIGHVFVSYAKEDLGLARKLRQALETAGFKVWLDQDSICPGADWKLAIERAIASGAFFIACFSNNSQRRTTSYMNEELQLAIEQLRKMPDDAIWLIPVRFSDCQIPAFEIRSGRNLRSKQWVDLYLDWEAGVKRILTVLSGRSVRRWELP
jgi:hypothetical protein